MKYLIPDHMSHMSLSWKITSKCMEVHCSHQRLAKKSWSWMTWILQSQWRKVKHPLTPSIVYILGWRLKASYKFVTNFIPQERRPQSGNSRKIRNKGLFTMMRFTGERAWLHTKIHQLLCLEQRKSLFKYPRSDKRGVLITELGLGGAPWIQLWRVM